MNDSGGQGRYDEGEEAVAEHADALEERHAATEQLGVQGNNRCAAPRDDEHGPEHQAAVISGGEGRVDLVGGGALAGQEDGESEAQDEGAPQVPVLQLSARLQQRVSLCAQCVVVVLRVQFVAAAGATSAAVGGGGGD